MKKSNPVVIPRFFYGTIVIGLFCLFMFTGCNSSSSYWSDETLKEEVINTSFWDLDGNNFGENEVFLSVSPSGKYILTVDHGRQDLFQRFTYGANIFGRQLYHLSFYEKKYDSFHLVSRIELDPELNPEFNCVLASSDETGIAWNQEETLILISGGTTRVRGYHATKANNLYLVDFSAQTFERLTNHSRRGGPFIILPQWSQDYGITFVRSEDLEEHLLGASLVSFDLETRTEAVLANLSIYPYHLLVNDYVIHNHMVYFVNTNYFGVSRERIGLFKVSLEANQSSPTQLLSMEDIWIDEEVNIAISDTTTSKGFTCLQVSPDGNWLLLTGEDPRFFMRNLGIENIERRPSHSIYLYHIETSQLVNPYVDDALRPSATIVTAATFAPDGKSMLVATFGSGGQWNEGDFDRTTLYQIRLDDGSFDSVQIFRTDLEYGTPGGLLWLENHTILLRPFGEGLPPFYPVQIVKPSAFERFN